MERMIIIISKSGCVNIPGAVKAPGTVAFLTVFSGCPHRLLFMRHLSGQPLFHLLERSVLEYHPLFRIEQVKGGHRLEVVHLFAGKPLTVVIAVHPTGGKFRLFPRGGLALHAHGEEFQMAGLQQAVHNRGQGEQFLHPAAVLAIRIVEIDEHVTGLYVGKPSASAVTANNGEIRRHVSRAVFQRHFQQVTGTYPVRLFQSGMVDQRTQKEDMQFLVVHGRVGFVQVLVAQRDEMIEHFLVGQGAAEKGVDRFLRLGSMGQYADEVHKRLLGDFGAGYEDVSAKSKWSQ